MALRQPCVDKYGSVVCNLPRFESTLYGENMRNLISHQVKQSLDGIRKDKEGLSHIGGPTPRVSTHRSSVVSPPTRRSRTHRNSVTSPERKEEKRDFTPYRQPMPKLRPNAASLSVDERAKAQMVRAGKTANKKGFAAAQAQMAAGTLSGRTIDTE